MISALCRIKRKKIELVGIEERLSSLLKMDGGNWAENSEGSQSYKLPDSR